LSLAKISAALVELTVHILYNTGQELQCAHFVEVAVGADVFAEGYMKI
jgi:hypothetical protein